MYSFSTLSFTAAILVWILASQSSFAQVTVTTNADAGPGSLRQLIVEAPPGSTITFDPSLSAQLIRLTSGPLIIDKDLTIDGSTLLPRATLSSVSRSSHIFEIKTGTVTLVSLTIFDTSPSDGSGAGIFQFAGSDLTIRRCDLTNGGEALFSNGDLQVLNSAFSSGGGIQLAGGTAVFTHVTVTRNDRGIFLGPGSSLQLLNTIVSDNDDGSNVVNGGGILIDSGGNYLTDGAGLTTVTASEFVFHQFPERDSPVLDAALPSALTIDQRGLPRVSGAGPDIGAVEFHSTVLVTTTDDEDNGPAIGGFSLREAIKHRGAGEAGLIAFAENLNGQTIHLTSGKRLEIDRSVVIDASALPDGVTISGDGDTGVFTISYQAEFPEFPEFQTKVTFVSLTITGGAAGSGGAIYNDTSILRLNNCTVTGNSAVVGGGIFLRGSDNYPYLWASCVVQNSTISGNTATSGGGVLTDDVANLRIADSTVSGNHAFGKGGGILVWVGGQANVNRCLISGNSAEVGGGIADDSGWGGSTVSSSTITDNSAETFGGGFSSRTVGSYSAYINHCTITNNHAGSGGGGISVAGRLQLKNSIVSHNTSPTGHDIHLQTGGTLSNSSTINLIGDPAFRGPNDIGGDPRLAPLGDFGGPTLSSPPLPDSPVIDLGGDLGLTSQRGFPRNGPPDLGAVEFHGTNDIARFWTRDFDRDGSPFGLEHAVGTDALAADPGAAGNLAPPVFNSIGEAEITFGHNPAARPHTTWILTRSLDLTPGSFVELYRFYGPTQTNTIQPCISLVTQQDSFTITDCNPPQPAAFYRVEARFSPPQP